MNCFKFFVSCGGEHFGHPLNIFFLSYVLLRNLYMLIMVETRSKHCILSLIPTDTTVMLKYMYFNLLWVKESVHAGTIFIYLHFFSRQVLHFVQIK